MGPNFVDKLGRLIERMVPFVVITQSVNRDRDGCVGADYGVRAQNDQKSPANGLSSRFSAARFSSALPVSPLVDDTCSENKFSPKFPKVLEQAQERTWQ